MIGINEGIQLTTSIIDLITGLSIIPFIFLLIKRKGNKTLKTYWLLFLCALSLADIFGAIIHAFKWNELVFDILWILIFPVMFLIPLSFILASLYVVTNKRHLTRKELILFSFISVVLSIISIIVGFVSDSNLNGGNQDVLLFVIWAAGTCIPCFILVMIHLFKYHRKSYKTLIFALIPQLVGLPFQLFRFGYLNVFGIEFNQDGIYHSCLLITVIIASIAILQDVNRFNSLIMLVGIPGSGKSTATKHLLEKLGNAEMISSDKTRDKFNLDGPQVWPYIYSECKRVIDEGNVLIFDATNITREWRDKFMVSMKELDVEFDYKVAYVVKTNPETCRRRVELRNQMEGERYLPLEVIDEYFKMFEDPTKEEGWNKIIFTENNLDKIDY